MNAPGVQPRKLTREQVVRARELRKQSSAAERIFWKICRRGQLGFDIRRQHPYEGFYLDFYCPEAGLAIEFDGEQHDPATDDRRDAILRKLGIDTLRISNRDFFDLDEETPCKDCVELIIRRLEEKTGRRVPRP